MPLSEEQLREERRKARQMAMMQALSMIEQSPSGLCSACSDWQTKLKDESQRSCKEIEHLRGAIQKLVDQLAVFMPGASLRPFLKQLQLDERLFTIHAGGDFYRNAEAMDCAPAVNKELDDIVTERDLAKMKLGTVGRELNDLKKSHEALTRQYLQRDEELDEKQRSLAQAEAKIKALESSKVRIDSAESRLANLEELYNTALAPKHDNENHETTYASSDKRETPRHGDQHRLEQMESKIGAVEAQSKRLLVSPGGLKSRSKTVFREARSIDKSFNSGHMSVSSIGDLAELPDIAATSYKKFAKHGPPSFDSGRPLAKGGGSQSTLWSVGNATIPDAATLSARDISSAPIFSKG